MFGRNRPRDRRLVDALAAAEDAADNLITLPASPPAEPAPPPAPAAPASPWIGAGDFPAGSRPPALAPRDNEIALIETAWEAINGLAGEAARKRAIQYILDRLGYIAKDDDT